MANYIATSRTNYFTVTDEEQYKKLFCNLTAESNIEDFTKTDLDGKIVHGFGAYDSIGYIDPDTEENDFEIFLQELQKILPEGEAFIYLESGHEKLRYVVGDIIVVTANDNVRLSISEQAKLLAKSLLNNEDFDTVMEY